MLVDARGGGSITPQSQKMLTKIQELMGDDSEDPDQVVTVQENVEVCTNTIDAEIPIRITTTVHGLNLPESLANCTVITCAFVTEICLMYNYSFCRLQDSVFAV